MIKRVYIDTSVFGGYFDTEFEVQTKIFFEFVKSQGIIILVSNILELEVYKAPEHIIQLFESMSTQQIERVELADEARQLAEMYITEKIVGRTSMADCQHIAIATINRADVLVSWNFKHIGDL
jgi:predicted nucleic acid-binding protein